MEGRTIIFTMEHVIKISDAEVVKVLDIDLLYNRLEEALGVFSKRNKAIVQPLRHILNIDNHNGNFYSMPCYNSTSSTLCTKLISSYPDNNNLHDLPRIMSWLMAFDSSNGLLKAVIESNYISEIRTSITSGIASKYLANPESSVLALLGSGKQARFHFKVICKLFPIKQVKIYSRTYSNCSLMAKELSQETSVLMTICSSADEAVEGADIVCTTTFGGQPCLTNIDSLKENVHINAVGACTSTSREFTDEVMRQGVVYCDSYEGCSKQSGDVIESKCELYAEIGEIINGSKTVKRGKHGITVFKSVGMAIEDNVCCDIVMEKLQLLK